MERFTERDEFRNADIIGIDSAELQGNLDFEEFNLVTRALNRLAEFEDKIESGQLVELPCIREVIDRKGIKYEIYFNYYGDLGKGAIGHYTTRDKAQAEARLKELQ